MAAPQEIYENILQQGKRATLPGAWRGITCHEAFIDLGAAQATLADRLQATFSRDDLLKAKVITADDQSQARLSPLLSGSAPAFTLGLQLMTQGNPVDLLLDGQTVSRTRWGWAAVLEDSRLPSLVTSKGAEMLVAFTQADLAVLWSLGLPAILGNGLHHLGGKDIAALCERLHWRERTSLSRGANMVEQLAFGQPLTLILVNWSPARLDAADVAMTQQVVEHFLKLGEFLGMEVDQCAVWKPQPAELEGIKFALQYGTLDQLQSVLQASKSKSCEALDERASSQAQAAKSYAEAVQQWFSLPKCGFDGERRKKAWDDVQKLQQTKLILPLVRQAQASHDPVEANLLVMMANLLRVMHPQMLNMAVKCHESIRGSANPSAPGLLQEELQQVLALADRVRAIAQEMQTWRKRGKLSVRAPSKPKKAQPTKAKPPPSSD